MDFQPQIPTSATQNRRFAVRLALFYGASFSIIGTYLPFFMVWLNTIGIEAFWIGLIVAVPSITRFTVLPFVTAAAERRHALRGALIITAVSTAIGFSCLGELRNPLLVLMVFAVTACAWTPMIPLTDGYALKAVARYGLDYGRLRLWGSAAFVVGALLSGQLTGVIAPEHLIWIIAGSAWLGAVASFALAPIDAPVDTPKVPVRRVALLRRPAFVVVIAVAALIQGSHAAYYTFASIVWRELNYGGTTIATLWVLGVIAEIVVFALSPRLTISPVSMLLLGGVSAAARWLIMANDPSLGLLAAVQLLHGSSYGFTQLGTMGLLMHHVPTYAIARGQGYLAAATGLAMSSAAMMSGAVFELHGIAVYYIMTAMAVAGVVLIGSARRRLAVGQPHSSGAAG
jgi:MFS transporter, PPP family, 3-phenylpropionic acid transporter